MLCLFTGKRETGALFRLYAEGKHGLRKVGFAKFVTKGEVADAACLYLYLHVIEMQFTCPPGLGGKDAESWICGHYAVYFFCAGCGGGICRIRRERDAEYRTFDSAPAGLFRPALFPAELQGDGIFREVVGLYAVGSETKTDANFMRSFTEGQHGGFDLPAEVHGLSGREQGIGGLCFTVE